MSRIARRALLAGLGAMLAAPRWGRLVVAGALCLVRPLTVEPLVVQRDLPLLIVSGVVLQMFITTGHRFGRVEAAAMIALYALFLAAQFMGFSISLP